MGSAAACTGPVERSWCAAIEEGEEYYRKTIRLRAASCELRYVQGGGGKR